MAKDLSHKRAVMTSQSFSDKAQSRRRRCCRRCLTVTCATLALLCIAVGVGITFAFDYVFQEQLKVMLPLANGSLSYRGWSKPPNKLTFQIWLWNVTNPREIVRGARPVLQQVGPFTFAETRFKADIEFYPNVTVSFREFQQFFYLPERSVGNISELMITSPNMPHAVSSYQMRHLSTYIRAIVSNYLKTYSGGLFVTRTAKEIILGYTDPALKSVEGLVARWAPTIKFQSTTGLFVGQNNTDKGQYLVHTGRGNISSFNRVQLWNGQSALNVWPTDYANRIVGTDGSMFGPGVNPSSRPSIFSIDICRSLELTFSHRTEVHGIPALSFSPSPEIMLNATLRPENAAFCSSAGCLDTGVMNISLCKGGVPLVVSAPHFTGAPTYAAAVDGLAPNEADYVTAIDIELNTGFVINAKRRMQMNLILERVPGFTETENLVEPMLLLPLMWLNESGGIDPVSAGLFKAHLLAPIQIVGYAQWALVAAGIVWMAATALVCSLLARRRRRRRRRMQARPHQEQQQHQQRAASGHSRADDFELMMDSELIRKLQDKSLPESDIY